VILALAFLSQLGAVLGHSRQPQIHPEHLFVKSRAEAAPDDLDHALEAAGAATLQDLPQIGWRIVKVDPSRLHAAREALAASGVFERVDYDHALELAHVPNDPYWYGMWHMTKIRADLAWDVERGDPAVRVAVIDTGLQVDHPDLAANVWTNPGEIAGNGVDDDGNGYADDVHGWDFAYLDGNPDDVFGHGTACAGIIAAVQDNGIGVCGVAPYCQIAGLKAAIDSGYLYDSAVVPALLYTADMGFKVASMSFYGDQVTGAQKDAIDYCWDHGVVLVAAAGNSSQVYPYYPGAFDHTLAVGASEYSDYKSWFSNHGSWVDVAAPGEGISTTTTGSGYTTGFAGTSGATPHVAGLAALLFSANAGATNEQVRAAIEDGSVLLDQPPYGKWSLYGRIDCSNALQRILGTSSGSVAARLTYVAPCGGSLLPSLSGSGSSPQPDVLFQGVGFELPNVVRVLRDGTPLGLVEQERQEVATRAFNRPSNVAVEVGGQTIGSIRWRPARGLLYAPSDASTAGGGSPLLQGGFFEVYRDDGVSLTCTRADDGTIYVLACIRRVRPEQPSEMTLELTRSYSGANGATENVYLYDWSTWSYPYGSFTNISSRAISSSATESFDVPISGNPARFVDVDGTVYLLIQTSGTAAAGKLFADGVRLRVR
jgi:hypothetical protein